MPASLIDGDLTRTHCITLPESLGPLLDDYAEAHGLTRSRVIALIVCQFFHVKLPARRKPKPAPKMLTEVARRVLLALPTPPPGQTPDEHTTRTVQQVMAALDCSEVTARRGLRDLYRLGLVDRVTLAPAKLVPGRLPHGYYRRDALGDSQTAPAPRDDARQADAMGELLGVSHTGP